MNAALGRLHSIMIQLPLDGLPPRVLEVGCGADPAASVLPGWTFYGVDLDGEALRRARADLEPTIAPGIGGNLDGEALRRACRAGLRLVQADARRLPDLLHTRFGTVLLRHPDLIRRRAAWGEAIPRLPALLPPGGLLLITLYAPEEVEIVQALDLPPAYPLDAGSLVPCDLAGHDRFALAYRTATIL